MKLFFIQSHSDNSTKIIQPSIQVNLNTHTTDNKTPKFINYTSTFYEKQKPTANSRIGSNNRINNDYLINNEKEQYSFAVTIVQENIN